MISKHLIQGVSKKSRRTWRRGCKHHKNWKLHRPWHERKVIAEVEEWKEQKRVLIGNNYWTTWVQMAYAMKTVHNVTTDASRLHHQTPSRPDTDIDFWRRSNTPGVPLIDAAARGSLATNSIPVIHKTLEGSPQK